MWRIQSQGLYVRIWTKLYAFMHHFNYLHFGFGVVAYSCNPATWTLRGLGLWSACGMLTTDPNLKAACPSNLNSCLTQNLSKQFLNMLSSYHVIFWYFCHPIMFLIFISFLYGVNVNVMLTSFFRILLYYHSSASASQIASQSNW